MAHEPTRPGDGARNAAGDGARNAGVGASLTPARPLPRADDHRLEALGPQRRVWSQGRALAVTLEDVEPRTFDRVRDIRRWLAARGIDRVTLAVVPAADLHPVGTRAPLLAAWLRAQVARGDAIAQHGLCHRGRGAEFSHLDREASAGRVQAGLGLLREAELDPHGFIAPAYGYTPALMSVLADRFDWVGERRRVRSPGQSLRSPVLSLGAASQRQRLLSVAITTARVPFCGSLMRLDIHPTDFDLAGHVAAIERLLARAADRHAITYDDLFCGGS